MQNNVIANAVPGASLTNPYMPNPAGATAPLIPNPVPNFTAPQYSLGLTQIEGKMPVKQFRDSTNTDWTLIKASDDPTMSVPDVRNIQWVDAWCAQHPDKRYAKVMMYVAEGVCMPRIETEKPRRVMFQWFSTTKVQAFNPQMVTDKDLLRANIYSASLPDARTSQLYALCQCVTETQQVQEPVQENVPLIKLDEIAGAEVAQG